MSRIDFNTFAVQWTMYIKNGASNEGQVTNGLTLSPDNARLAVYTFRQEGDFEMGHKYGYLFIVNAYSGITISREIYLKHA